MQDGRSAGSCRGIIWKFRPITPQFLNSNEKNNIQKEQRAEKFSVLPLDKTEKMMYNLLYEKATCYSYMFNSKKLLKGRKK
jgi:hypothetical protein